MMVQDVYLTTRRYEFQILYYAIILIFLSSKQKSTQFIRLEFYLLITHRLFLIEAVFGTDGVSLLYGHSSDVDELQTTPTGLSI
jgi:hypothetical protein